MAYEPTEWKSGDVVTSAKLNKLEQGVEDASSGGLVVHSVLNETTQKNVLDKTWQEIYNALVDGNNVCIISGDISSALDIWCDLTVGVDEEGCYIFCDQRTKYFSCASPDEYPEYTEG